MLQREKTHRTINPKSKAPPPLTTHPHRHVEENEARRRHRGRGNQCHGPDEALSDEHNLHCPSGSLELPVHRKLLLHLVDGGGLVAVVVEKARQLWRKCSQHLTKRRRGNVPLKPWPIPPGAVSVSETVSISARREVLNDRPIA